MKSEVCPKKVSSSSGKLVCPKRTISQLFKLLCSISLFDVPEENFAGEGGEESPVGGPEGPIEIDSVCETEAGTDADVEVEDEDDG